MTIFYIKALHLVFMVTWFSGLFFLGRLLIYLSLAQKEANDFAIDMCKQGAKRGWYIITLPSLILTVSFGTALAYYTGAFREGWFHFKLMLVIFFVFYNIYLNRLRKRLGEDPTAISSFKLRLINEVPFFFLLAIIMTVTMKNFFSGIWSVMVLALVVVLIVGASIVMRKRSEKPKE